MQQLISLQSVIVVLGSPNSDTGELSDIAKERLNKCLNIYKSGMLVICTGGWGEHFNTTETPHAEYAEKYLIGHGIPSNALLKGAYSSNSVDDAVKVKAVIGNIPAKLTVITSNYHIPRIKLIFDEILSGIKCNYLGVKINLSKDELTRLVEHEKKAVDTILNNGLYY